MPFRVHELYQGLSLGVHELAAAGWRDKVLHAAAHATVAIVNHELSQRFDGQGEGPSIARVACVAALSFEAATFKDRAQFFMSRYGALQGSARSTWCSKQNSGNSWASSTAFLSATLL